MAKSKRRRSSRSRSRRKSSARSFSRFWKLVSLLAFAAILAMLVYWGLHHRQGPENRNLPGGKSSLEVEVFFGNSERDPQALDCSHVYPVRRTIPATDAVARAAIEQLLEGPTAEEKKEGYFTSLNRGVSIRKLDIHQGTAWVDFGKAFDEGVAGSCRVEAIRAQVEQTLLQFESVRSVRITVEGRDATALQP